MNLGKQFKEGLITNNPVLVQVLGMCSTMAITTSFFNGLGTAAGIQILPEQFPMGMLTLPVGGFLILACLIAAMQWALSKSKNKEESK